MKFDIKKITFNNVLRVLALIGCLILIADSLPLLFLGHLGGRKKSDPGLCFCDGIVLHRHKKILITRPRQFYKKPGSRTPFRT